jgi:hypothetical protein
MRRIFAFVAAACLFGGLALPASAASGSGPPPIPTCNPGGGPCQETDHFSQLQFIGAPLNCPASAPSYFSGFVFIDGTGNGIQHINVNAAQDFWITTTFTGTVTIHPILVTVIPNPPPQPPTIIVLGPDPSRAVLTGRLQMWFGISANNKNQVLSDTGNLQATAPDGTMYSAHFNDHLNSIPSNPFAPHTIVMHTTCS